MTKSKHTPGPWKAYCETDSFSVRDPNGDHICWMACPFDDSNKQTKDADAQLIAAAPDLLEAAEAFYNPKISRRKAPSMLIAAIKKAKGE